MIVTKPGLVVKIQ